MDTPVKIDPHSIIQEIEDLDNHVAEKQSYRRQLVEQYHNLMSGYERHYNEVCNRPEPSNNNYDEAPLVTAPYLEKGRF